MLLFGHAGITLGVALLGAGILGHRKTMVSYGKAASPHLRTVSRAVDRLSKWVDIRWILVGALLSDIIDKPLGLLFMSNGRVFAHSLLFLGLLSIAGVVLHWRKGWTWMYALAFGTLFHLVLDFMWQTPEVFLWPKYGVAFPVMDESAWLSDLWAGFLSAPLVSVPEVLGFGVCITFLVALMLRRKVWQWLRRGTLE